MRAILGACNLGNSSETKINLHDVLGDTSDHNWRESSYNAAFTHLGKRAEEIRIETARETARYLLDQLTPTGKLIPQLPSPFLARKLGIVNNTVFNIDYVFKTRLPNVEAHLKYTGAHYPTTEIVVKPLS